jgi:hypothetical protein
VSNLCFWCNADPNAPMSAGVSAHSTWCPHYRPYVPPKFPTTVVTTEELTCPKSPPS